MNGHAVLTVTLLAAAGLAARAAGASGTGAAAPKVEVFRDGKSGPIRFAADEIRKALAAKGAAAAVRPLGQLPSGGSGARVVLALAGRDDAVRRLLGERAPRAADLPPQAYALRRAAKATYCVLASDEAGAMYGGLHVAETVRIDGDLDRLTEGIHRPAIARRGIKFNIPLDARTPSYDDTGDAAQQNIAVMWDFAFWREFLDEMARHRYNTLTLWNPHPFPSLVKLENYPDVALDDVCVTKLPVTYRTHREWRDGKHRRPENLKVVRRMPIDEKIAFWRRVMARARDRGIDVYLITWNVFVDAAEGKYGITARQDNPKTIAYLRACVGETVRTYPLLAGLGATAGERMQPRRDEFAKEKWLWRTYGLGVLDARKADPARKVRFLHRVWQTGVGEVMEQFGSKYPHTFELGFKYARAHMYSSTRPPFADALCREMAPHRVRCWWNLRNDDIFNFRWGDPDYVREFLTSLPPKELTAGYHMGSDGYVWGRTFTSRQADAPRTLEIRKHWYRFMLWGRLGYDPKLDRAFFEKVLAARFPGAAAAALYDAWQAASRIIPRVNRFHWRNWDFMWAVEGCMDRRKGFHTVDDFIATEAMAGSGIVSIRRHVAAERSGKPAEGTTPVEVAGELLKLARSARELSADVRRGTGQPDKELAATLGDVEAMAHLGSYYGEKILGAVALHAFRTSDDAKRRAAAVAHLSEAVGHWQRYAAVAGAAYRPQLLARTRRLDFAAALADVKRDVEIARSASAR